MKLPFKYYKFTGLLGTTRSLRVGKALFYFTIYNYRALALQFSLDKEGLAIELWKIELGVGKIC